MSGDPLIRLDLSLLYPPFLDRLRLMLAAMNGDYVATCGTRTFAQQARDYFQGRTMPGRIITHAPAGLSAHNYGLAVDFVRMVGITPSWAEADYEALGAAAEAVGLAWGGDFTFVDAPHVQWPGYVTAQELAPLRSVYVAAQDNDEDPLAAAWAFISKAPTPSPIQTT